MNNSPKSEHGSTGQWPLPEEQPQVEITTQSRNIFSRGFANYTLRAKMLIVLVTVVVLAVGTIASLTIYITRQTLAEEANDKLIGAASQTATSVDTFIQSTLNTVKAEAQLPDFVSTLTTLDQGQKDAKQDVKLSTTLLGLHGKDARNISSYALLDKEGINVSDSFGLNVGLDESDQDYFQMAIKTGQPYVSPVLFPPDTNQGVLYFSSPVRNVLGEVVGVLRVAYKAGILQKLIKENTAGEDSFAVLFDENHLHLAHSDEQVSLKTNYKLVALPDPTTLAGLQAANRVPHVPVAELSTDLPDLEQNLTNLNPEAPYFETVDETIQGRILNQAAVASLDTQPWALAFFQPQAELFEPVQTQTRIIIGLAVLISAAVAGVAVVVSQQLAKPIVRLTEVAGQVAQGDLNAQAPVESQDEIGQLSVAFNSMTGQLRTMVVSLEDQVRDRTAELLLSIEVGQRAAAIRNLEELLPAITEFIRDRFDLYYVHVYFVDDTGRNLVIQSGTGQIGKQLMARRHTLRVGSGSIVGQTALRARSIVVSDTESSDIHKPNPLLPETRSELAVPLIVEGRVIGVLDMQASRANTFEANNLAVFEAMATQLAISIDSAQQWALAQEEQRRSEEAVRQLTRQSWTEKSAASQGALSFAYDLLAVRPLEDRPGADFQNGGLLVPVLVQNEPIGQLSVDPLPDRSWSEDEHALLDAVAQQLAQKAENLRLFEETQQQAAREQMARRITDKIRASRDIETALNTAAQELSNALGTARAVINLTVTDTNELAQTLDSDSSQ